MNRIHVITLGVKDINKSLKFYRDGLGFKTSVNEENPPIVFFQSRGVTFALCPKSGLAEDINSNNPPAGEGFSNTTLAYIVDNKEDVEKNLLRAEKAGGKIAKPPQKAFWGGNHGYFSDPDGFYWEVMFWDGWKFNKDGSLRIA
jgi:catechol 2,3-dioxygenase-like lactoylglutathione lyase family enzyme